MVCYQFWRVKIRIYCMIEMTMKAFIIHLPFMQNKILDLFCKILISADLKTSCRHNPPIRITYISCFRTDKSSMRSQMTRFHIYQALMGIFRHTSLYLYVDDKAYTWLLERHKSKLQKLTNLPHLFVVVQTVG